MTLIPQTKYMACWYAAAQMLIRWKQNREGMTLVDRPCPEDVPELVSWEVRDNGVTNPRVIELAQMLGLKPLPPVTPTKKMLLELLKSHGPLWCNGSEHIVVIAGIGGDFNRDESTNDDKLLVYNPAPLNVGKVEWRGLTWYLNGGALDSRDTSPNVQAIFLYNP